MLSYKKIKKGVKNVMIFVSLWALFVGFLMLASARIQGLDANSYTENGKNKAVKIEIGK